MDEMLGEIEVLPAATGSEEGGWDRFGPPALNSPSP